MEVLNAPGSVPEEPCPGENRPPRVPLLNLPGRLDNESARRTLSAHGSQDEAGSTERLLRPKMKQLRRQTIRQRPPATLPRPPGCSHPPSRATIVYEPGADGSLRRRAASISRVNISGFQPPRSRS